MPKPISALAALVAIALLLSLMAAVVALPLALMDGDARIATLATLGLGLGLLAIGGVSHLEKRTNLATVGSDGVALVYYRRRRFVPWRRVRAVQTQHGVRQVVLELDDGSREVLRSKQWKALARDIRAAQKSAVSSAEPPRTRVPDPAGQDLSSWMERVRGAGGSATYRADAPTEEELLDVLGDPQQDPIQRVGSALALSASSSEHRQRIRVAAEETADPDLERALTEVAAGELRGRTLRRVVER